MSKKNTKFQGSWTEGLASFVKAPTTDEDVKDWIKAQSNPVALLAIEDLIRARVRKVVKVAETQAALKLAAYTLEGAMVCVITKDGPRNGHFVGVKGRSAIVCLNGERGVERRFPASRVTEIVEIPQRKVS